ncbi:MAG: hypothetical protein OEZ16_08505, partial [Chromatiales bacterium]|nr:hypothetical protein [Chromatiales bacterium]
YGIGVLVFVAFLPFTMLAYYFAPQWYAQGYETLPNIISNISDASDIVSLTVAILCSFIVPIILRAKYWSKLSDSMANK